jgi:hypothetical protein
MHWSKLMGINSFNMCGFYFVNYAEKAKGLDGLFSVRLSLYRSEWGFILDQC